MQRIRWKGNEEHVVYLCSVWKKFELSEAEKDFMKRKIFLFQSAARNVGSETVLRKMKRLFREGKKEENAGKCFEAGAGYDFDSFDCAYVCLYFVCAEAGKQYAETN